MPQQELFFEQPTAAGRIEVLKTYDQQYAREVFSNMDEAALQSLWDALKPEEIYDPANLPSLNDPNDVVGEAEAFLWDELVDQAREHDNIFSFFVVNEVNGGRSENLYVSPDWPKRRGIRQEPHGCFLSPAKRQSATPLISLRKPGNPTTASGE
jgi:hypothetical protein